MSLRIVSVIIAVICSASRILAADWPGFRGPGADGISPETGLNLDWKNRPPRVLWTVRLGAPSYSGPAAANGCVFILDHKGDQEILRALDLAKGRELWRAAYPDTAVDLYGFARSTPAIDEGRVYTLSRVGLVRCFDVERGRCLWSRDLVKEFEGKRPRWDYSMSPLIDGEKLIVCPGGKDAAIVALDKKTGKNLWKGGGSVAPVYATPVTTVIGERKQFVLLAFGELLGIAAEDGSRLWSYSYDTFVGMNAVTPLVIGNRILVSGIEGGMSDDMFLEITTNGPTKIWKKQSLAPKFNTPIFYQGYVYGTTTTGHLACLEPSSGTLKWKQPGFEWGGALAYDGHLVVANGQHGDFVLVRMDPGSYDERGRVRPLGGQTWTAPILANGKLIVRNKTSLACLDLH